MTTRALEDKEIEAIFEHLDGCNTTRNRAMLISIKQRWTLDTDWAV